MARLSAGDLLKKIKIGNDAGWILGFHIEEAGKVVEKPVILLSRDDYYAEIEAELPEGLEGGTYKFTLEGITDKHYAQIRHDSDDAKQPGVVRLYMFWRDTNASLGGTLANIVGITDLVGTRPDDATLVAELAVSSTKLTRGERRYEVEIKARERVFHKLSKRVTKPVIGNDPLETAMALARTQGIDVQPFPVSTRKQQAAAGPNAGTPRREEGNLSKGVDLMRNLARRMEEASGNFGRGMLLIRDGKLLIGEREISSVATIPPTVTFSEGLIQVEATGSADLELPDNADPKAKEPPKRKKFKLTFKGRPDLKPGHVVRFDLPPQEVKTTLGSKAGSFGNSFAGPFLPKDTMDNPSDLYISSVAHKLGRKTGFVTVVTGVEIKDRAKPWDPAPPASGVSDSTPEGRAVIAMHRQVRGLLEGSRPDEVAEVRAMNVSGSAEPPSQTVLLWRGLAASDGRGNQSRRLDIERPTQAPATDAPYLTPFAWGKTGLVLPRYPGTRVLVSHRDGRGDEAVDVGALWESGTGPDSEAGDWWLILPVGVPPSQRASLAEGQLPTPHEGQVSHDLVDADGNRVIEVGELTVRVGRTSLKPAGHRPARAQPADSVTIEHADGNARVVIASNGTISIEGTKIELNASGDIDIKAANVKVGVSGSMDVGNR